MTLSFVENSVKKLMGGNPGGNIPGLGAMLKAVSTGYIDEKAYQTLAAAGSLNENAVFLDLTGSGTFDVTIPQAINAPGKIIFVANAGITGALKDDLGAGARTIATVTSKVGAILFSTGDVSLGTYGWFVLIIAS